MSFQSDFTRFRLGQRLTAARNVAVQRLAPLNTALNVDWPAHRATLGSADDQGDVDGISTKLKNTLNAIASNPGSTGGQTQIDSFDTVADPNPHERGSLHFQWLGNAVRDAKQWAQQVRDARTNFDNLLTEMDAADATYTHNQLEAVDGIIASGVLTGGNLTAFQNIRTAMQGSLGTYNAADLAAVAAFRTAINSALTALHGGDATAYSNAITALQVI